jgi:oligoribonuclease
MAANEVRRAQVDGNLVWLDLEMTGLDPERDSIIQAALIVTDRDLNPLEEFATDVWQPEERLAVMTPFVREMHTKTGLLERLRTCRTDVRQAERELMTRVAGWCPFPAVLCGNSIWSDRKFVEQQMPGLARYLHYRMVDVSSLKVLAASWYGASAAFQKNKDGAHDALVDVRASIAELRHYRAKIFRGA